MLNVIYPEFCLFCFETKTILQLNITSNSLLFKLRISILRTQRHKTWQYSNYFTCSKNMQHKYNLLITKLQYKSSAHTFLSLSSVYICVCLCDNLQRGTTSAAPDSLNIDPFPSQGPQFIPGASEPKILVAAPRGFRVFWLCEQAPAQKTGAVRLNRSIKKPKRAETGTPLQKRASKQKFD